MNARDVTDESALLWLCGCTELDPQRRAALLRAAPSPKALFLEFEKFSHSVISEGENGLYTDRELRLKALSSLLAEMEKKGYFAVTSFDEDYPEALRAADPPLLLFGMGRRELLKARKFCIVGSRVTPPWAEEQGRRISERLSKRFAIVTGLAEGGDLAAVKGALPGGNLICVLPCGLDECYPAAHESLKREIARRGLLLSEYPPHEKTRRYSFHARNRILAGISEGTLVISAGAKSGALITAYNAAEYGREVFAFPYSLGSAQGEGCNGLIKRGAYLCTGAEDIFSAFGMEAEERTEVPLGEAEERVLAVLREEEEPHTALIAERAGMQVFEVAAVLSSLELKGLAVKSGGNRYKAL